MPVIVGNLCLPCRCLVHNSVFFVKGGMRCVSHRRAAFREGMAVSVSGPFALFSAGGVRKEMGGGLADSGFCDCRFLPVRGLLCTIVCGKWKAHLHCFSCAIGCGIFYL